MMKLKMVILVAKLKNCLSQEILGKNKKLTYIKKSKRLNFLIPNTRLAFT